MLVLLFRGPDGERVNALRHRSFFAEEFQTVFRSFFLDGVKWAIQSIRKSEDLARGGFRRRLFVPYRRDKGPLLNTILRTDARFGKRAISPIAHTV